MTTELIIFGISNIACLTIGFYFGYLKREDKVPFEFPMEPIKRVGMRFTLKKEKEVEPKGFYD